MCSPRRAHCPAFWCQVLGELRLGYETQRLRVNVIIVGIYVFCALDGYPGMVTYCPSVSRLPGCLLCFLRMSKPVHPQWRCTLGRANCRPLATFRTGGSRGRSHVSVVHIPRVQRGGGGRNRTAVHTTSTQLHTTILLPISKRDALGLLRVVPTTTTALRIWWG